MPIVVPDYKAPSWCPGGHLQTVIPAKFMPRPAIEYRREKVELPDGDFMLWDWAVPEPADPSAPVLVHFHGLEGSSRSHYAEALMAALAERVTPGQAHLEIVEEKGRAGGGSLPMCDIPTFCVRMRFEAGNAQGCEEHLQRNRDVPVIGRIKRECVLFDARTITEEDIPEIACAVASYFAAFEGRKES